MKVGLGNLYLLKAHLLGLAPGEDEVRFDDVIKDIGKGVAAQMENFCDRKFSRVAGDTVILAADRASFSLPRYPVEAVTLVEVQRDQASGFVALAASVIRSISAQSGMIYLADSADVGRYFEQLRFTYTGGYFFETMEPTDDPGYPTAVPAGAAVLPDDLKLAWLTQCRRVWSSLDKLGTKIVDNSEAAGAALASLDWSPEAKEMLARYRRMQLV